MTADCQTMQPRQRTSRSQQEHCPCGCGQMRFVLRELVSPDGLRWVLGGEQIFMPQAPQTHEPGIWEIGRVREYDYLSQMVQPVQD